MAAIDYMSKAEWLQHKQKRELQMTLSRRDLMKTSLAVRTALKMPSALWNMQKAAV
ncbi:hypothetical protein RGR602_PB00346 (plasmid) [Rhizobium gallicum bv. gallicum R602sp]|uniref:Uncharacterized protein n=1 Tax=Rhizobium gallicum bv. gallicum R602sp TaxID=1041138 RepID=A0A0B4XB99_9HYPH|nr:hypothetical protein RGR602_PB00346 [Rhizobium gallicum bv. gallicum R602sp]